MLPFEERIEYPLYIKLESICKIIVANLADPQISN